MYRNRYISAMIFCVFLITVLMGVSQTKALLYDFGDPNQLNDFVIDESDWESCCCLTKFLNCGIGIIEPAKNQYLHDLEGCGFRASVI